MSAHAERRPAGLTEEYRENARIEMLTKQAKDTVRKFEEELGSLVPSPDVLAVLRKLKSDPVADFLRKVNERRNAGLGNESSVRKIV